MKLTKIRVTAFDAYENCPYCFYLQMIGIKQAPNKNLELGSLVHKGIEEYHRFNKRIFPEKIDSFLKPYIAAQKNHGTPEQKFEIPNFLDSGILLTGTIDLIQDEWIHEHKTSASRWTQQKADEHKQATAYSFAYRYLFGREPKGIRFNVLIKNKTPLLQQIDTWRTEEDYQMWQEGIRDVFAKIKNDQFEPNYAAFWHNFSICPGNLR